MKTKEKWSNHEKEEATYSNELETEHLSPVLQIKRKTFLIPSLFNAYNGAEMCSEQNLNGGTTAICRWAVKNK